MQGSQELQIAQPLHLAAIAARQVTQGKQVVMRYLATAAVLSYLAAVPQAMGAEPSRVEVVVGLFQEYCLNKKGEWADLDRRASDAHYAVVMDETAPVKADLSSRQKNWLLPSPDGHTTVLTSMDISNAQLRIFSCGIYAPDLSGDSMETALSALPSLGSPTKHTHPSGGAMMTWWWLRVGDTPPSEDSEVTVSREIPGIPGIGVSLVLTTHLPEPTKKP